MNEVWTLSRLIIPGLLLILGTCVYGANEIRMTNSSFGFNRHTAKEMALAVSFLALGGASGVMLWGAFLGAEVVTWRGAVLINGFACVLFFAGKFQPWRKWLRRTVPIQRQWSNVAEPTAEELNELLAEVQRAFHYGPDEAMRVLPKVIAALEPLTAKQYEIERIRAELVSLLAELKSSFRKTHTLSPETVAHMDDIITRLQKAVQRKEPSGG